MVRFESLYAALARAREEARSRLDRVRRQEGVRPGDVYLAPDVGAEPAYLVVTGAAGGGDRWCVLLADDNAALRADVDLRTAAPDGALLSVRTDRRAALPASMLPPRGRVALLSQATLVTLQEMARAPRDRPAPRPHDLTLSETLRSDDDALRLLRAEADGPPLPLRPAPARRAPPGAVEAAVATGLASDGGAGALLRDAAANQPTCFVLHIDGGDALSAACYPRDGVHLRFRGAPGDAPEVRAVYCDHERHARWEEAGEPGEVSTRDAFPWEDDSVELRIGAAGYVVRVTRPAPSAGGPEGGP